MAGLKGIILNKPILIVLIFLLVPTIKFGNYRIYPAEIFSLFFLIVYYYGLFFGYFKEYLITRIFNNYFIFYLILVLLLTIAHSEYNSGFSSIFRNMFTSLGFAFLFENLALSGNFNIRFLRKLSFILILPPVLGLFQYFNFYSSLELLIKLYDPIIETQYSMGIYDFLGNRVPSIFKDYFHAGLYYILIGVFFLKLYGIIKSNYLLFFYMITLLASFYSSRMAFYLLLFLFIVFIVKNIFTRKGTIFFLTIVLLLIFTDFISYFTKYTNIEKHAWALELFLLNGETSSSNILFETFKNGLSYIFSNLSLEELIFPAPKSFNVTDFSFYSDSFYVQEIIRSGLLGIVIYMGFIFKLYKCFYKRYEFFNFGLFLIIILFFLNYKGGNVFFLERCNLILVLIFIIFYYEKDIVSI